MYKGQQHTARPQVQVAPLGSVLPEFFIIGHPKCGTTALYEALRRHPEIFMPDVKEPQFFATETHGGNWRALKPPPETLGDYLSLFTAAKPGQRVGEASVLHLWSHTAAKGIADLQPSARIIAILREPASFLRSLHLQLLQSHIETHSDLQKALSLEDARRQGQYVPESSPVWQRMLLYSDYVRYCEQLRRYHNLFPSEQVLVLIYDDLRRDNERTMRRISRFLDIGDSASVSAAKVNPTVRLRSAAVDDLLRSLSMGDGWVAHTVKRGVKLVTTQRLRRSALATAQHRIAFGNPRPPDEAMMLDIRRRFKPEVVALSKYIDRDLVELWGYDGI